MSQDYKKWFDEIELVVSSLRREIKEISDVVYPWERDSNRDMSMEVRSSMSEKYKKMDHLKCLLNTATDLMRLKEYIEGTNEQQTEENKAGST